VLQVKPHALPEQLAVALPTLVVHLTLQPLQLFLSLVSLTQLPLQLESPAGQPVTQLDPEQSGVPPEQACEHDPQLFLSVVVSTQALPHLVYPLLHVKLHVPVEQVAWPFVTPGHLLPHAWQFCGSFCSSTQVAPQRTWPEGQPDTHTAGPPPSSPPSAAEAEHTGVPASRLQATPQKPQFELVFSWTQVLPHSV
jgi:hypothetical protein